MLLQDYFFKKLLVLLLQNRNVPFGRNVCKPELPVRVETRHEHIMGQFSDSGDKSLKYYFNKTNVVSFARLFYRALEVRLQCFYSD